MPSLFGSFLTGISILQAAVGPLFERLQTGFIGLASGVSSFFDNLPGLFERVTGGIQGAIGGIQNGVDMLTAGAQTMGQVVSAAFNAISKSPLVQQILRAFPVAAPIAEAGLNAFNKAHQIGENAGNRLGLPPAWSALLGLAVPALALRVGGGLLGGGIARGVGGGLLRGGAALWGGAMANPITRPLIDGAVLGGIGYSVLQRRGALGKEAPGLGEAIGNTWTRLSNLWSGRDYNSGVSQMRGNASQHAAALAAAQANSPEGRAKSALDGAWGGVASKYQNNLDNLRRGRMMPTLNIDSSQPDGNARGLLDGLLGGVSGWARDVQNKRAVNIAAAGHKVCGPTFQPSTPK